MRKLIYIPIFHTQADMGTFAESIRRSTIEKFGQEEWERHVKAIDQMWDNIHRAIEGWNLPFPHVRVYQDGLPNCGREMEIVGQLANAGSPNHQLLLDLVRKGATLMGTESAGLLLEEYQLFQQMTKILSAGSLEGRIEAQHSWNRCLLERRDRYIAERINSTLSVGEVGLVFLGLLHSLEGWLAADIHISYRLGRPTSASKGGGTDANTKGPHRRRL